MRLLHVVQDQLRPAVVNALLEVGDRPHPRPPAVGQPQGHLVIDAHDGYAAGAVHERLLGDVLPLAGVGVRLVLVPVPPDGAAVIGSLVDKALDVLIGAVRAPPDHVLRQDVRRHAAVEAEPQDVGPRADLLELLVVRLGPAEHQVDLPEREQHRPDLLAEPLADLRSLAVDVLPPRAQRLGPLAADRLAVDPRQVPPRHQLHERGHRRAVQPEGVEVAVVGAHLRFVRRQVPLHDHVVREREPLARGGVPAERIERVAPRLERTAEVVGVAVPRAPLEGVKQPPPVLLHLGPDRVPPLHELRGVVGVHGHGGRDLRRRRCSASFAVRGTGSSSDRQGTRPGGRRASCRPGPHAGAAGPRGRR